MSDRISQLPESMQQAVGIIAKTAAGIIEDSGIKQKLGSVISSQDRVNIDGAVALPMSADDCEAYLIPGDVIGIKRGLGYEHFAVYSGNGKVIHFAADKGDFGEAHIHEAPLCDFLEGQNEFFVLDFSCAELKEADGSLPVVYDENSPRIYTAEDTLKRARSVLGANEHNFDTRYDLVFNNCEHFAIWCKTGQTKSYQVERLLNRIFGK